MSFSGGRANTNKHCLEIFTPQGNLLAFEEELKDLLWKKSRMIYLFLSVASNVEAMAAVVWGRSKLAQNPIFSLQSELHLPICC